MALATAAAIAGLASAGIGVYKGLTSGGGTAQQRQYDLMLRQLQDSNANRTAAQVAGANINQLATAGFSDGQGGGLQYDRGSGTWRSTLGPQAQAVQSAADAASIGRNTTDMVQAQGANARADLNASRAQPLIDAARRRLENFRPQTAEDLTSLLASQATQANEQAYAPVRQDTLRTAMRSGSGAGDIMSKLGESQADSLRKALMESRIAGMTNVDQMNNQRRQGLGTDMQVAMQAGTPQFQYPGITPSTNNKDMLAAMASRSNASGYTSALGLNAVNAAQKTANDAAGNVKVPNSLAELNDLESGVKQIGGLLGSDSVKKLGAKVGGWFGDKPFDYAAGSTNLPGTSPGYGNQLFQSGGIF
jgi:hypothetical protein